jgi:hypothetical protein
MEQMRLYALALGNGKTNRKREYTNSIENATRERDKQLDETNGKTFVGKALESFQAGAAGVATFFLALGVLRYLDTGLDPYTENAISFGAGYTAIEAVNHIDKNLRKKRVKEIICRYDSSVKNAKNDYDRFIRDEYGLALDKCRKAWESTFDESPVKGTRGTETMDIEPLGNAA